ncbi:hypothetical protein [Caldimonas tepidiphila]|uniref:hypothetical protein n=1 Tax=Caldimonas tepidiphila TaxID=2315841 RepID=UPI001F0B925D|nr:hypothetical protein [Caldimonas tepidiphila]
MLPKNPPNLPISCRGLTAGALVVLAGALATPAQAQGTVYRCPGNSFTNSISEVEAQQRGCKPLDGGHVSVLQTRIPRTPPPAAPASGASGPAAAPAPAPVSRPADSRVSPSEQRARDSDARRILEAELRKEEERLAELHKEYNKGEPERRGDERNYARYQERVSEMKAGIARKESDIAAIKRELAKLPQ